MVVNGKLPYAVLWTVCPCLLANPDMDSHIDIWQPMPGFRPRRQAPEVVAAECFSCPTYVHVYHVTNVASGHRLLKKFRTMVKGCILRTLGSFQHLKL